MSSSASVLFNTADAIAPEAALGLVLGSMGVSIMKSGLTKGEIMFDVPAILALLFGVYHDLTLAAMLNKLPEAVAAFAVSVVGSSPEAKAAFLVAIGGYWAFASYSKLRWVLQDVAQILTPS